jgi:hypothetical protein
MRKLVSDFGAGIAGGGSNDGDGGVGDGGDDVSLSLAGNVGDDADVWGGGDEYDEKYDDEEEEQRPPVANANGDGYVCRAVSLFKRMTCLAIAYFMPQAVQPFSSPSLRASQASSSSRELERR